MIMKKSIIIFCLAFVGLNGYSQDMNAISQQGEFGIAAGGAQYFGDLNTRASLARPKFSAGIFFVKQFGNYIGLKIAGNYARLGYTDKYSLNTVQRARNLSFNTNIWEFSASGQFNFFKFAPGDPAYAYTPYVSLGVGVFSYDPYAYLLGEKQYLRPLGTEGQGSTAYPDRVPYGSMAVCFPFSIGMKYNMTDNINVFAEIGYRFTTTDYLDDVSTTYAPDAFPNGQPEINYLLSDRSYETGDRIGIKGRQRGNSQQKDAYVLGQIGVSFNISTYNCPRP